MVHVSLQAIVPKRTLNTKQIQAAYELALQQTGRQVLADFQKTTRTWATKVDFYLMTARQKSGILELNVGTDNLVYHFVSRGTRPHKIRPKRARFLRFQWGGRGSYRAKTKVGKIASSSGGPSGPIVYRKDVSHPGTKARHFEEAITKRHANTLKHNADAALHNLLAKQGDA